MHAVATLRWAVIAFVCFAMTATAMPTYPTHEIRAERISQPQDDPFYQPPEGYESQAAGAILRTRNVTFGAFGFLPVPVSTYQLLYRTTAVNGTAIASVTTVFKPLQGAKTDRFVTFATAEDSSAAQCAPSFNYRLGANQTNVIVAIESLSLQTYLGQGYIVSSPDYGGPDSAFTAGRLSGTVLLDSMRAVKNFKDTLGFSTDDPAIAALGYSGGAIATAWAASLHPTSAKDLNVKAWVAGGVPANLSAVVDNIDGGFWAGYLPTAIAGLGKPSAYAAQTVPLINDIATQNGLDALQYVSTHCQGDDLSYFSYKSIKSTDFQKLGDRFLYDPRVKAIIDQQTMGVNATERPSVPTMIYHSANDEVIPYSETNKLVDRWCAQGSSINFLTLANGGHVSGEIVSLIYVSNFIKDAFDGKVASKGCTRKVKLQSILNPIALGASLEPLLLKLLDLLHQLGEGDANVKANPSILHQPPTLR